MIVLAAALASGNSAIMHNAEGILGSCVDSEVSYYSVPYSASVAFPRYSPSGIQPIKSIANITYDIPIVIVHSKEDRCLPYDGVCALYYGLRSQGHENVYLKSFEGGSHIQIFRNNSCAQTHLRKILKQHAVIGPKRDLDSSVREKVQPEIDQFRELFERLCSRECNHSYVPWVVGTVVVGGALFLVKLKIAEFCTKRGIDSLGSLLSWFKRS